MSYYEEMAKVEERYSLELLTLILDVENVVRSLIRGIALDSKKHVHLLRGIRSLGDESRRAMGEEDIWDMIWRDVLGHGAPLG